MRRDAERCGEWNLGALEGFVSNRSVWKGRKESFLKKVVVSG